MLRKPGCLINFTIFTESESFFDKAAGSQLTSLLKKGMQEFSCDFCKIFKNSFIKQTLLETGYEI